jgi:hypothetical protein
MSPKLLNLFLAVGAFALYYLVLSPLYNGAGSVWQPQQSIAALQQANGDYDVAIAQAGPLATQADILKKQYAGVSEDSKQKMKIMVPDSIDPVRLMSEVDTLATKAGFNLQDINYAQGQSSSASTGSYRITFTVKTTYPKFKQLMHSFETSLRLFSIQSVSFSVPDKSVDIISFQVTLETYYIK